MGPALKHLSSPPPGQPLYVLKSKMHELQPIKCINTHTAMCQASDPVFLFQPATAEWDGQKPVNNITCLCPPIPSTKLEAFVQSTRSISDCHFSYGSLKLWMLAHAYTSKNTRAVCYFK